MNWRITSGCSRPLTAAAEPRVVILPALDLCLVKAVGKGALGSVGSRSDQHKNLHNITNHCTRSYAKLSVSPKVSDGG